MIGGFSADYFDWRFPFFLIATAFAVTGFYLIRVNRQLPAHAKVLHKVDGHVITRMIGEFRRVLGVAWARKVLATVLIEGALVYGALAFVPTHLHTRHGTSLSASGALVMLFGMGGFFFAIRSRYLVRQLGEAGLIRYGAVLMTTAMLIVGYSPWWWTAMPACFVFGLGFYMMHNTLQINATQMAPERRGAAVAAFASCFFLGQSAGVAAGGSVLAVIGSAHLLGAAGVGVLLVGARFARLRAAKTA
jgi:predicted MFS family arabinose efflux permease